jgi:hypothetical protein
VTGTYTWAVAYSGDVNNAGAADQGGPAEQTIVSPANPTLVTTASPHGSLTLGTGTQTLSDSAVLAGAYHPTGTMTFTLTYNGNVVDTETVPVTQNGTYRTPAGYALPTSGTVAGAYLWHATYFSGDSNNANAADGGANEAVTIVQASPTIVTTAGANFTDSAVLAGGFNPTGNILFTLNGPAGFKFTKTVPVNGNGTYSASTAAPVAPGEYTWTAVYSGNSNNLTAHDQGGLAEWFSIARFQPTLLTQASPYITITTNPVTISDTAVLSGGFNPTGNIVFTLNGPAGFVYTQTDAVNGNGTYTASTMLPATATLGSYVWSAAYSGDGSNFAARDQGGPLEETDIGRPDLRQPAIVTSASPAVTLGTQPVVISDTAVLSDGANPTGTLTFTLTVGNAVVFTSNVAVTGNGIYRASYPLPVTGAVAGLYTWSTSYSGDTANKPAQDQGGPAEQTNVYVATPSISTVATPCVVNLNPRCPKGKPVPTSDTATLTGGYFPTGSIVFTLTDPKSRVIYTQVDTVNGDGVYKADYTIPKKGLLGTYKWSALFVGDANNAAIRDSGANETMKAANRIVVSPAYKKAYRPFCPKSPYFGRFDLPLPDLAHKVVHKAVCKKVVYHR